MCHASIVHMGTPSNFGVFEVNDNRQVPYITTRALTIYDFVHFTHKTHVYQAGRTVSSA